MNLLLDYQKKIFKYLKNLEGKKKILIPTKIKSFSVELPPKNQKADMSCNAAMVLSKANNISSLELAKILKKHLLSSFNEFTNIEIAGPGFLNISFTNTFWKQYLQNIIKLNDRFGSGTFSKKKI